MIYPTDLINQLENHGVNIALSGGQLQIKLPWPPEKAPASARTCLRELKARKDEVKAYLSGFDENEAYRLFCEASIRTSENLIPEAWNWAVGSQPELVTTILAAEQEYSAAYRARDMDGCRVAVERYRKGFSTLRETYRQATLDAWQPMKEACRTAGHCLALTVERDCNLYPDRLGWCRHKAGTQ